MTVKRIVPNLSAGQLAASRDFYAGLLGLDVAMDLGWVATLAAPGSAAPQLTLLSADPSGLHPDLTIEVDDVEAVHAAALSRGVPIVYPLTTEPWGVRRFFVRDPGGHVVNIMQHL